MTDFFYFRVNLTSNQSCRFDWRLKTDLSFKIRIWLGHCEYWTCLIDSSLDSDLVSPYLTRRLLFLDWLVTWLELVLTHSSLDLDIPWLTFPDWLTMWLELILTDLAFQFGLYWLVTRLGPIWRGFSLNLDLLWQIWHLIWTCLDSLDTLTWTLLSPSLDSDLPQLTLHLTCVFDFSLLTCCDLDSSRPNYHLTWTGLDWLYSW